MDIDSLVNALKDTGDVLGRGMAYGTRNIKTSLPEALRNYVGNAEWQEKKQAQDLYGGDFEAQERADKMMGFGTDAGGLVGMIKASHGSPHMFDKFDFTKIGTGEGAQAYGHGGYFAEGFDSPTAKEYQKQLAADVQLKGQPFYSGKTGKQLSTTGNPELDDYLMANLGDVGAARANLLSDLRDVRSGGGDVKDYQRTLADLRNIRGDVENADLGHLYNVELKWPDAAREASDPLGEHHLLDWDAPMSEQPDIIQDKFHTLKPHNVNLTISGDPYTNLEVKGHDVYNYLSDVYSDPKKASDLLKSIGIPGIRYLDQGSRGAGSGTRNYVMFDDQIPEIVSRNGIPVEKLADLLRAK